MSDSKRRVPKHPVAEELENYLGATRTPESREGQLAEWIGWELMTGGYNQFNEFVYVALGMLKERGESASTEVGQKVLAAIAVRAAEGEYGDFYYWMTCHACEFEFRPRYSLIYVNAVIERSVVCPRCDEPLWGA